MPFDRSQYERDMLLPPTVCRGGCGNPWHTIPDGGLPEGVSLGKVHRAAAEENICLTHVAGGCFNCGTCEEQNRRVLRRTCNRRLVIDGGNDGRDFTRLRQAVRVAAGLPARTPDANAPTRSNREQGGHGRQLPSSASTGRDHHGAQEGSSRRAGEPQTVEEETPRKRQCFDHGCNGRRFSSFSNLLRHQREKSRIASKSVMPAGRPDTDAPTQSDREQGDHGVQLPGSASTGREHHGTPEAKGRSPREPEELRERPGSSMGGRRDVDVRDLPPMVSPTLPECVEERFEKLRGDMAQTNRVGAGSTVPNGAFVLPGEIEQHDSNGLQIPAQSSQQDNDEAALSNQGSVDSSHGSETDSDNPDTDMLEGETTEEEDWVSIGAAALRRRGRTSLTEPSAPTL
ncbi:MAG: hypothetical protein Q9221_004298 [Calogaya cf. arnoldii]